jgi:hypothetical protein
MNSSDMKLEINFFDIKYNHADRSIGYALNMIGFSNNLFRIIFILFENTSLHPYKCEIFFNYVGSGYLFGDYYFSMISSILNNSDFFYFRIPFSILELL